MLVRNLLVQGCIQAFLKPPANGRPPKAQSYHILSINCRSFERAAILFLQDLIDDLRDFLKDRDPTLTKVRFSHRIRLVQFDQL